MPSERGTERVDEGVVVIDEEDLELLPHPAEWYVWVSERGTMPRRRARPQGGIATAVTDRIAIYPGSFDPPTNGHLDIVERASKLFDRVVVAVGRNRAKKTFFADDDRIALMREACARFRNVEVQGFDTLTVEFARSVGARFIIRGIRALSDFEFEFEMANMNRRLAPEVEMVFLMTAPEYLFLSASRVKELAAFGAPIVDDMVPPNVAKRLRASAKRSALRTGATEPTD